MPKPYYCGARKVPKNRVRGTADQCIRSGQARYYGVMSVEDIINQILAEKTKLANEKAKIKRQQATKSATDAKKKITEANVAVKKAKKDQSAAKKAEAAARKPAAKKPKASTKKIKPIPVNQSIKDILKQVKT